jgi:predicted DNA-binding transcriptional regulator YafY
LSHSKLQRWTDLIAALLARQYPVTFDDLAREVPAYAAGLDPSHKDSVKRTFERDKDELREFGVPIESIPVEEGESTGYRLRANRFYLPYLTITDVERGSAPARPPGYRALPQIEFDPEELGLLAHAVQRLEQLGDPALTEDARSAGAKLLFDISFMDFAAPDVKLLGTDGGTSAETFELLATALRRRKSVAFRYHAPTSGAVTERHVHPYGLFFIHAHWYLAGFDRTRDSVRNFRLSRMSDVVVNKKRPQSSDYEIPDTFRLREHAQSRTAWDLGDAEQQVAEVRFTGASGASRAAERMGEPVNGSDDMRRFAVRRQDVFARWLLSFGGTARPVSPPSLVDMFRQLARETLGVYGQRA